MIGRKVPHRSGPQRTIRRPRSIRLARQVWANRARFTRRPGGGAGPPATGVSVELQERLLEPGGLDRQSGDRGTAIAERNGPRRLRAGNVSSAVGRPGRLDTPATPSRSGGGREPHLDVALPARQQASGCPRARPAGRGGRSRPVADPFDLGQQCDEKKIVRPSAEGRRGSSRRRIASAGRGPRSARRGSPARVVLERLDDAELLAHPPRIVANGSPERRGDSSRRSRRSARRTGGGRPDNAASSSSSRSPVSPSQNAMPPGR